VTQIALYRTENYAISLKDYPDTWGFQEVEEIERL